MERNNLDWIPLIQFFFRIFIKTWFVVCIFQTMFIAILILGALLVGVLVRSCDCDENDKVEG